MEEVRSRELRSTLEDLMYVSILEKFLLLGVEMLPRMDGETAGADPVPACAHTSSYGGCRVGCPTPLPPRRSGN